MSKATPDRIRKSTPVVRAATVLLRLVLLPCSLYGFLLSIALMEAALKGIGLPLSKTFMPIASNPFIALAVGLLATSIAQSSSCTTSLVVGLVASGTLDVGSAIPMVMGANIGTTVTNTIVSLGHITRREEFRRAFAAATVHDFFNLLTTAILLPVELTTHYLEKTATLASRYLAGTTTGVSLGSPLKPLFSPAVKAIAGFPGYGTSAVGIGTIVAASMILLFVCLYALVRLTKGIMADKIEVAIDKTIGRTPLLALLAGLVLTALVQSSSVVTSLLVPLAASGIVSIEGVFPMTLGANIGTTVTAILAALATGPAGLTIALVHLLFNLTGTAIFLPLPALRKIPIGLARGLANLVTTSRWYALIYVLGIFFALPGVLIVLWRMIER